MPTLRELLEKEVSARVNPEAADKIMLLADLHALAVGGRMVESVLTQLCEKKGIVRGGGASGD